MILLFYLALFLIIFVSRLKEAIVCFLTIILYLHKALDNLRFENVLNKNINLLLMWSTLLYK